MKHPRTTKMIEDAIVRLIECSQPVDEDVEELTRSAAEIDVEVETLRAWREDYKPWTTVEEWREQQIRFLVSDIERIIAIPGPRHWSRWRITRKLHSWLYLLGISSGGGIQMDWSGTRATSMSWSGARNTYTGKRNRPVYVLGWPVRKWRCLLVAHHWPTDDTVAFDLCLKCCPCPDCGEAAPLYHDCEVAA